MQQVLKPLTVEGWQGVGSLKWTIMAVQASAHQRCVSIVQAPPHASAGPALNPAAKPPRPPTLSKVRVALSHANAVVVGVHISHVPLHPQCRVEKDALSALGLSGECTHHSTC